MSKLTPKQRKFIELYSGNASEAALAAGYSVKTAAFIGAENLKKPQIRNALQAREAIESRERIATRQDRQAFWTKIMQDQTAEMRDRLKASELLGKSEADFLERREIVGPMEPPKIVVNFTSPGEDEGDV